MPRTLSITLEQLAARGPCSIKTWRARFGLRRWMTVTQALRAGATLEDILWVAGRLGHGDRCARFAEACADRAEKALTGEGIAYYNEAAAAEARLARTRAQFAQRAADGDFPIRASNGAMTAAGHARAACYYVAVAQKRDGSSAAEREAQDELLIEAFTI